MSSSCCGGKCGCGSDCKCGNGCGGCKMFPDVTENAARETLILGVAGIGKVKSGSEMGVGSENGGCPCGATCNCNPCTCKK